MILGLSINLAVSKELTSLAEKNKSLFCALTTESCSSKKVNTFPFTRTVYLIVEPKSSAPITAPIFSYKPLYICLKWCTKKASADYDQCLIRYPLFGSLFLLAIFFFFSFLANSCSSIDEDFSFRLSTNRNLCNSCRSKFFRSQQISEFVYS